MPTAILSNLPLPPLPGYTSKTFGDYPPPENRGGLLRPEMERRTLAEILSRIPSAERPEILLFASPEYLPIPTDIANFPGLKILLITDWNVCLRFLPALCPLFDFCFTDWPGYRILKQAGVPNIHHQPLFGHDPAIFRTMGTARDIDVSFCGNLNSEMHTERNRLVAKIAWWSRPGPEGIHTPQSRPPRVSLRQAFGQDYVNMLNRSRLVFNYSIRGEANMRLFESMACGAVPLVEEGNQEVSILFQEGVHYFRYAPGQLETTLDLLLADPARLQDVSTQVQAVVTKHTKANQMLALLHTALKSAPLSPVSSNSTMLLAGRKSALKIRILGMGYTYAESLQEIQAEGPHFPGLEKETQPALLLSLLMGDPEKPMPQLEAILSRYLQGTSIPEPLRSFLAMTLAKVKKDWQGVLVQAEQCLQALKNLENTPALALELNSHFHPPVNLGKGLNSDLNYAYRQDLGKGKPNGYRALLEAHCAYDLAQAYASLGDLKKASEYLQGVPGDRYASLDPYPTQLKQALLKGDFQEGKQVLHSWFALKPLKMSQWQEMYEGFKAMGDKEGAIGFLREILALVEVFENQEWTASIAGLLAQELNPEH